MGAKKQRYQHQESLCKRTVEMMGHGIQAREERRGERQGESGEVDGQEVPLGSQMSEW